MNEYLVTIHTECGMYEETVDAQSSKEAVRIALRMLIDDGEIDPDESISYTVEEGE